MSQNCNIVRDLLPLYVEKMLSADSQAFVEEHLKDCPDCQAELESLKSDAAVDASVKSIESQIGESSVPLKKVKKAMKKKKLLTIAIAAASTLLIVCLLHYFPVYRLTQVGWISSYYSGDEMSMLVSIGSHSDRTTAQSVLRKADEAFHDLRHTREENEEKYGPLARYATTIDRNGSFNEYTLELWSAHFDDNEGYIWVFYSDKVFDCNGNEICGSSQVPSLWKVQKDESGEWNVVSIKEHP